EAPEEEYPAEEYQEEAPEEEAPRRKKKKTSSNSVITALFVVVVLLVVGFFGFKYYKEWKDKQDAESVANSAKQEADKAQEDKQREAELTERLTKERAEGVSEGERNILNQIRQSLENGSSVAETLRSLYADQIVVSSGGVYHFIPIDHSLKKNDYVMENLVVLDDGELQYQKDGEVVSYKGIDVSKFQGDIDWKKVAADGVEFAMIRVDYRGYGEKGTMVEDPMAKDNLRGANAAGIKTGVYFYTQAITEDEIKEEANAVIDLIKSYKIDCPFVSDVERVSNAGARMNKIDVQTRTKLVKMFCDSIGQAGYNPMIYHNLEMGAVMLDISELEVYDKWFAYYNSDLYYPYAYKVWQYTDKGHVDGIAGEVDLNIAFVPLWQAGENEN
ncbi:MAG: glycoside hydrolase family 25 protein, partial [Lachnospiraceae bacterium]|nr:glycoside hydrolase family 25 protein [Lachnospiraceae bacterium]